MSQHTLVVDLNRCIGCMGCNTACKTVNEVPIGNFWNRVLRVGPYPKYEGATFPDVDWYYLPMQCQHCASPECVQVCPTGASVKLDDGTVQIDAEQCIGCQACVPACPYGARYLNEDKNVVQKCNLCKEITDEGGIPQCVSQCVGLAKWYGDIDEDPSMMSFRGGYEKTLGEVGAPFTEDDIYTVPDEGNGPAIRYILRNKVWQADGIDFTVTQGGHGFGLPNY